METQPGPYREWDARQWAGEDPREAQAADPGSRWNAAQWIGDQGTRAVSPRLRPRDAARGDSELSGFGHNPGVQHWVGSH